MILLTEILKALVKKYGHSSVYEKLHEIPYCYMETEIVTHSEIDAHIKETYSNASDVPGAKRSLYLCRIKAYRFIGDKKGHDVGLKVAKEAIDKMYGY